MDQETMKKIEQLRGERAIAKEVNKLLRLGLRLDDMLTIADLMKERECRVFSEKEIEFFGIQIRKLKKGTVEPAAAAPVAVAPAPQVESEAEPAPASQEEPQPQAEPAPQMEFSFA